MKKCKVWTNQFCDTVISTEAPNAGYWCVFSGTTNECYTYLRESF